MGGTLSLMVGQRRMRRNRRVSSGRTQRRQVRSMVSHTFGCLREFLAVPEVKEVLVDTIA